MQYHFTLQVQYTDIKRDHELINQLDESLSLSTLTNLVVHECLQALDKFMLVPFINTLLPKKGKKDMVIIWTETGDINMTCDVKADNSLFLVQELLQSIQKKPKTLMTKVIDPTRNTKRYTNISFLISCDFSVGLLQTMLLYWRKQTLAISY